MLLGGEAGALDARAQSPVASKLSVVWGTPLFQSSHLFRRPQTGRRALCRITASWGGTRGDAPHPPAVVPRSRALLRIAANSVPACPRTGMNPIQSNLIESNQIHPICGIPKDFLSNFAVSGGCCVRYYTAPGLNHTI